ncbi:MAG TPA: cytochrome c3 family protein, partial [Thermoanaerobaculia bacterium]|nr:cytochrome c3 family protein [Thermoanaerobaculia bacterium]
MKRRAALAAVLFVGVAVAALAAQPATSCVACHSNTDFFDPARVAIVTNFAKDVHATLGLSCHDCHGGNPDPALADDMTAAMDAAFAKSPYRGVPQRGGIPEFCGRCHSDLNFMRRFNPNARVDQVEEYWTSRHGQSLRAGDEKVATCVDCHGVHGTLRVGNPDSTVYPTHVAETCGKCHGNPELMAGRTLDSGAPLPVDQFAKWSRSVHAAAMFDKADLTAPTCNDCHGNHGALPPGVASVANVCGQCHGREAELFRTSTKQAGFETHNSFLSGEGCSGCHEAIPAPPGGMTHFSECATCHQHHGVIRPTVALLAPLPATPCAFCHEPAQKEGDAVVQEREKTKENYVRTRDALIASAANMKLDGDARFDWMVDQAQALPVHVIRGEEGAPPILRPEFARLFQKFRIGKTHYTYTDPVTKKEVPVPVVRCTDCHKDPEGAGLKTASAILSRMQLLTGLTARAERNLLAARRGGVEVRQAAAELDAAVDSQIELEVLVHRFEVDGAFAEKQAEGLKHANAALQAGEGSLGELTYRRRGLIVALAIIVLVLIALGLKIRDLSARG